MTFYILLSTVAMLTAVVGCALIWGYDRVRAEEIRREVPPPADPELAAALRRTELEARAAD